MNKWCFFYTAFALILYTPQLAAAARNKYGIGVRRTNERIARCTTVGLDFDLSSRGNSVRSVDHRHCRSRFPLGESQIVSSRSLVSVSRLPLPGGLERLLSVSSMCG